MPNLNSLLDPASTAVVTMEVQRGVVGDLAALPALAAAAQDARLVPHVVELVDAAREAGATVIHCLATLRADGWAAPNHAPFMRYLADSPNRVVDGSEAAELVHALGPEASDGVSVRHHGLTPFTGTDLDALLRASGARTIVAAGASVNVGIVGLALNAVDLGYNVVVPSDAVVGVPLDYVDAVLRHTLAAVGTVTDVASVVAALTNAATPEP